MGIEREESGKPKDTVEVIEKIPKCRVFSIQPGIPNEEYEALMKRLLDNKCEAGSSSGRWSNEKDEYLVQIHYFEIKKTEKRREDTDFKSTDELTDEMEISEGRKEDKVESKEEESIEVEAIVKAREGAMEFDGVSSSTKKKKNKKSNEEKVDADNA